MTLNLDKGSLKSVTKEIADGFEADLLMKGLLTRNACPPEGEENKDEAEEQEVPPVYTEEELKHMEKLKYARAIGKAGRSKTSLESEFKKRKVSGFDGLLKRPGRVVRAYKEKEALTTLWHKRMQEAFTFSSTRKAIVGIDPFLLWEAA